MKRSHLIVMVLGVASGVAVIAWLPTGPKETPRRALHRHRPIPRLPVALDQMGYALLPLLQDPFVQRELQIDDAQRQALVQIADGYAAEIAPAMRAWHAVSKVDEVRGTAARESFIAHRARLLARGGKSAEGLLSEWQKRRLGEVLFRLRGIEVFEMPEIVAALQLTAKQQSLLRHVRIELEQAATRLSENKAVGTLSRPAFDEAVGKILEHAFQQALHHLTDEQRRQAGDWAGKPIAFSRQQLKLEIRERQLAMQ